MTRGVEDTIWLLRMCPQSGRPKASLRMISGAQASVSSNATEAGPGQVN